MRDNVGMVVLAQFAFGYCTSFLYGWFSFLPWLDRCGCKKCKLDQGLHASHSQSNSPHQYTAYLLALDGYRPIGLPDHSISEMYLNITAWEGALADHPDKLLAHYLIQSLKMALGLALIVPTTSASQPRRIYCPRKPILKWLKTTRP